MIVYKIIRPQNITEAYVREVAEKCFGMPPDAKIAVPEGSSNLYRLRTDKYLFRFESDTGFFSIYKYTKARQKQSRDRKDFPSDEECEKIATEYLKERGLLPEDAYLRGVGDSTSSRVMSVAFGKKIDGYKGWGPGAQILVHIGPDGEIVKVLKQWIELEPWKMAPIKTPKEALKELRKGKAFMGGHRGKITNICLRYDTPSGLAPYSQPVYWFDYTGPSGYKFYAAVPAIKSEYLK
jgi:mRNA-degrading endonuclease RelE of RelBE toxin-antitoxin system